MEVSLFGRFLLVVNIIFSFGLFISHIRYLNKFNFAYKIFTFFLGYIFMCLVLVKFFMHLNAFIQALANFFLIGEFLIINLYFFYLFEQSILKKIIKISVISLVTLIILNLLSGFSFLYKINEGLVIFVAMTMVLNPCLHFYEMLTSKKTNFYLLNIGGLIYQFGSVLFFLSYNYLHVKQSGLYNITFIFHNLLITNYFIFVFLNYKNNFRYTSTLS